MGSIEDIMQLCRLCLVKDQVNIPIFDETSDIRQTFMKINQCLPVKVSRDDNLPKKICDGCSYKLDMLYVFRNTTVDSEKQLITWLSQLGSCSLSQNVVKDGVTKPEIMVKQETFETTDTRLEGDNSELNVDAQQELGVDAHSYIIQQQKLPYQQDYAAFGEPSGSTGIESEEPAPKRAKRAVTVKKHVPAETEEDVLDTAMQITKAEQEEDSDDVDQPDYVEAPSTSADDQPGPSGVGKGTIEAPFTDPIKIEEHELTWRDEDSEKFSFGELKEKEMERLEETGIFEVSIESEDDFIKDIERNYEKLVGVNTMDDSAKNSIELSGNRTETPISGNVNEKIAKRRSVRQKEKKTLQKKDEQRPKTTTVKKSNCSMKKTSSKTVCSPNNCVQHVEKQSKSLAGKSRVNVNSSNQVVVLSNVVLNNEKRHQSSMQTPLNTVNPLKKSVGFQKNQTISTPNDYDIEVDRILNEKIPCNICQMLVERRNLGDHNLTHYADFEHSYSKQPEQTADNQPPPPLQNPLRCVYCNKEYDHTERVALNQHLTDHLSERVKCDECDQQVFLKHFPRHKENKHGIKDSKCKVCGETFEDPQVFTKHMTEEHPDEVKDSGLVLMCDKITKQIADEACKPLVCPICSKQFKWFSQEMYRKHLEKHPHSFDQVRCDICNNMFHIRTLKKHKQLKHDPNYKASYPCKICGKMFRSLLGVTVHEKRIHLNETNLCEICGKTAKNVSVLKAHIRTHHNEKLYSCGCCKKMFYAAFDLKLHMVVHTREKCFACKVCGKKYSYQSSVIQHMKSVHSTERPFKCYICPKKFTKQSKLNVHLKKHQSDELK